MTLELCLDFTAYWVAWSDYPYLSKCLTCVGSLGVLNTCVDDGRFMNG